MKFYLFLLCLIILYFQLLVINAEPLEHLSDNTTKLLKEGTKKKSRFVKEINNVNELINYTVLKQKLFVEIYSPTCPHCINFEPKYETLASIYKDKIEFIRVDGSDPIHYRAFAKIHHFPTLFLYDNKRLFEYRGNLEIEDLHEFIETVYYFQCRKLETEESLINFINNNTKNSYVLGVFKNDNENLIDIFNHLNKENRMIIDNCVYYIDIRKDDNISNNKTPHIIYNLPEIHEYILSYNKKSFQIFDGLPQISENLSALDFENEKNNPKKKFIEQIELQYKNFLLNNLFGNYENWDNSRLNNILSRGKNLLIFSYKDEEEKLQMIRIVNQFTILKNQSKNYDLTNLLFNLYQNGDSVWNYYSFGKKSGIYITDCYINRVSGIDNPYLFDIDNLMMFLEEYNNKDHPKSANQKDRVNEGMNFVTAKIVDNLSKVTNDKIVTTNYKNVTTLNKIESNQDIIKNDSPNSGTLSNNHEEKQIKIDTQNVNIDNEVITNNSKKIEKTHIKILIYLFIYTIVFGIIYKKFLSTPVDDSKDN